MCNQIVKTKIESFESLFFLLLLTACTFYLYFFKSEQNIR